MIEEASKHMMSGTYEGGGNGSVGSDPLAKEMIVLYF